MNNLINPQVLTMSSREIAKLVESNHPDVKRSMERLRERGLITFESTAEKSTGGRPAEVYLVNKRDSYVVVAQLSPEFTARLVDRWQELEARQPKALPKSYRDALRELIALDEAREEAERQAKLLEIKLDEAAEWASVKKIESREGRSFSWQPLKHYSMAHGYDMPKVFDQNYERGVNAYHADVWFAVYGAKI